MCVDSVIYYSALYIDIGCTCNACECTETAVSCHVCCDLGPVNNAVLYIVLDCCQLHSVCSAIIILGNVASRSTSSFCIYVQKYSLCTYKACRIMCLQSRPFCIVLHCNRCVSLKWTVLCFHCNCIGFATHISLGSCRPIVSAVHVCIILQLAVPGSCTCCETQWHLMTEVAEAATVNCYGLFCYTVLKYCLVFLCDPLF